MIAGPIAASRSTEPTAAGFRVGFLGGVVTLLMFIPTVVPTAT